MKYFHHQSSIAFRRLYARLVLFMLAASIFGCGVVMEDQGFPHAVFVWVVSVLLVVLGFVLFVVRLGSLVGLLGLWAEMDYGESRALLNLFVSVGISLKERQRLDFLCIEFTENFLKGSGFAVIYQLLTYP